MKKRTVFFAAALAALFAVPLAGCGGDLARAREYAGNGDRLVAAVEETGRLLQNEMSQAFDAVIQAIGAGGAPDVSVFTAAAAKMRSRADSMLERAAAARTEYARVNSLKDPGSYREYADLRMRVIDTNTGGLRQLEDFLDEAKRRLAADPFEPIAFQIFVTRFGEDIQAVGVEAGKLEKQARDLKKNRNI